ncbi:MAG: hypothetical protein ACT4QA_02915, partial [Panacagrimonas sp.]
IRSHRVAPLRSNAAYRGAGRALDTRRFAALLGPNGVLEFKLMHYRVGSLLLPATALHAVRENVKPLTRPTHMRPPKRDMGKRYDANNFRCV